MQVAPSGGQICNSCKWCQQVAKFATNASSAFWWPNLLIMQLAPSDGQICNWFKWCHIVAKLNPSYGVNFWVRCTSGNVFVIYWNIWSKWICGCHSGSLWLSRPMHGSLNHISCVTVVCPHLELICDFRRSKLPVPSRPATRSFCHYPTRSRPEVKNQKGTMSPFFTVFFVG